MLTQEEREIAAKCADNYPRGFGDVYLAVNADAYTEYELDTTDVAYLLIEEPELLAFG